jgi:serine/threonine protein kinase
MNTEFIEDRGYQVLETLGSGASADVLLAASLNDGVESKVAVKIPRTPFDKDRMRAEGRLLTSIRHPHLIQLFEVIDTGTDVALVLEYLPGRSAKSSSTPVDTLVPILEALHALHGSGWVHGDVKPGNIGFRADGSPVLFDLGSATHLTNSNAAFIESTPGYLDPITIEEAQRSPGDDLYAVGVIGSEMLAAERSCTQRFSPGTFDVERFTAALAQATHPNRSERFGTAAEFIRSLTEVSMQSPESPHTQVFRPLTRPAALATVSTASTPKRRHLAPTAILALVCTLIVLSAVFVRAWRSGGSDSLSTGVLATRAACNPEEVAYCVDTLQRTPQGIAVRFRGSSEPTQYVIGRKDDVLRVGNFFCGSTETLALYRPSTGVVYYFKEWPSPGTEAPVLADATGIVDARLAVGEHDRNGCADIALDLPDQRTWLSPATTPERLTQVVRP